MIREVKMDEVRSWPACDLLRGVRMTYKGMDICFPKVYFGESDMEDFDVARSSVEFKEAKEALQEQIVLKKALTLCSRVLLCEAYEATKDNIDMQEAYGLRQRKRKKILAKIALAEEEFSRKKLEKDLEELPELPQAPKVFPTEDKVVSFKIEDMSGKGVRPVDTTRLFQAYSTLNLFEQEEVENFLNFPGK